MQNSQIINKNIVIEKINRVRKEDSGIGMIMARKQCRNTSLP